MFADWGGLRMSLLDVDHKGGELKNTASGRSFDDMSQLAGRVKLLLKPFDQLESTLTLQRSKTDGDYWPVQLSDIADRSEEHTSELQSLMRILHAVFCFKKKK